MNTSLTIQVVNGQLKLIGPIQDRVLCYGLLELAKDGLREMASRPAEPKIEEAGAQLANVLLSRPGR